MNDEKLINLVKEHDVIFNKQRSGYKVVEIKTKAWREIAVAVGASVEECTKRWTTLRDRFVRECRRMDQPTGSAAISKEKWDLFDSMLFLKEHTQARRTQSSINILKDFSNSIASTLYAAEDDCSNTIGSEDISATSTELVNRKRKSHDTKAEQSQFSEAVDTFKTYVSQRDSSANDEFTSFASVIKHKLQRLPRSLSNKGMQDILNYVIMLEDFNEGISTEFPNLN